MGRAIVHGVRPRGTPAGQGGGSPPPPPPTPGLITNRDFAVIGDSLTERAFASTPIYWQNGVMGAPLRSIANSGLQGRSILDVRNQIDNSFLLATGAGFGGLPPLGVAGLRIGTNNVRGAAGSTGIPISAGNQADYQWILNRMKEYAEHIIVFPVPPIGGFAIARNTAVAGYNTFLQGLCASDPRLHWIDDCFGLVDANGNVLPQFFDSDELHMNGLGSLQMALDAKPQLEALMLLLYGSSWNTSRLVTDPSDVFPTQPQWVVNPTNVGTSGTFGSGWSGTAPAGASITTNGVGIGGTVSIVPADVGDPNQVPWMRITPTSANTGSNISIQLAASGRTITSSDPDRLEQLLEVRGNGLLNYRDLTFWLQAGGLRRTPNARLRWGASTPLNARATLQQSHHAIATGTGAPIIVIYIQAGAVASGPMGSIDLRCMSIRG